MGVYWHTLAVILHDFLQPTSAEIHRCKFINFNSIIEHEEYCVITHHRWMKYTSNMERRNCVVKRHFITCIIMMILCYYMVILCHDLHVHVPLIIDLSGSIIKVLQSALYILWCTFKCSTISDLLVGIYQWLSNSNAVLLRTHQLWYTSCDQSIVTHKKWSNTSGLFLVLYIYRLIDWLDRVLRHIGNISAM